MSRPVLSVQLLGGFGLVYKEMPAAGFNSARLQSLLAYLILHADTPQSRQHLSFLLWPDASESQARNNLRQLFYQLRQTLPDSSRFLIADTTTLCWKTDAGQILDVFLFERALSEADAARKRAESLGCRHNLEQAVAAYRGDLLPDCYDDWIGPERERLRRQYGNACQTLMHLLETEREFAAALQAALRLRNLDPLDESAYISLIRLYGLLDDRAGARRTYQTAINTFKRELDMEPGEELQAAYQRIQRAPRKAPLRAEDTFASGDTLVGRQAEWQQLLTAWQRAVAGGAHLCLITGEAGIGKSRLAAELFDWVARQGYTTAHTRSYGAEGNLSLAPITEWLRNAALRPYLSSLDPVWLTEIARLLPEMLSEYPDLPRPEPINEYGRRRRFFEALARGALAAPGPLLLWVDDLHWCDQETLEWLHFLLRFDPRSPALILGTARSDESPPDHPLSALIRRLQAEGRVGVIELSPFDAAETAKLASQVQGRPLDDSAIVRLYRETEGNPLFVVEAVRAGIASPLAAHPEAVAVGASLDAPGLPPRVQAIIAGRLAQLSPTARTVAEIGAAIGRVFSLDLLLLVGQENEDTVIHALDELCLRRIVREQSANVYDFTHDKLREVTCAEISRPQLRLLHRRIAQALEALNTESIAPVSARVAAHYEQAGLIDQAIPYYEQAGSVAAGIYANEDAITLFTRGLELLGRLPISVQRDVRELNIQLELATVYRISKGWASPEEERVMNRLMVLSDKVGNVEQRIRTLFGLQTLYIVQAKFEKAERTYAQVEKLFLHTQAAPPFAQVYCAGMKLHVGQMAEGRALFDRIVAVRDDKQLQDSQESQGLNYLVHGLAWNSHALWCLGYPESALKSARSAVGYAREFAQPFNRPLA